MGDWKATNRLTGAYTVVWSAMGSDHIQLQLTKLTLVENIYCRIDGENRVEIVAFPFHSGLIVIAAGRYGDETCLQKIADTFQSSVFGQTSFSGNGIVAGMAGVCFAVLDQQQISVDQERRRRQVQQKDFVRECEKIFVTAALQAGGQGPFAGD